MPTIFNICTPREDVRQGTIRESEFAADLAKVLNGTAGAEYLEPERFFANTHPTEGLKALLTNVFQRVSGAGGEASAIFRLDTQYGGGKTHALIALAHVAAGARGVANIAEFLDTGLVPRTAVRVAAFDGENADPANGRLFPGGIRAYTPWGELAVGLGGAAAFDRIRASDTERQAPGAETLAQLFDDRPAIILLDELSVYLRKVRGRREEDQLTPFLTGLFKAVESSPGVVLVFTLAIGKTGEATDAYAAENTFLADKLAEAESVAARKATLLEPTAEHETAAVLKRRLFQRIDETAAAEVVEAYKVLWEQHRADLPQGRLTPEYFDGFRRSYPLHPELLNVLTDKLATLDNFQRVRGMLRLLTHAVAALWETQPQGVGAVHLHHLDPSQPGVRNEVLTRLGLRTFSPAIDNDVASSTGSALAQRLDARDYPSMTPVGSQVARSILWHSFAFNEPLKGASIEELRLAVLAPGVDLGFINDARQKFTSESAYLDDRPGVPLRFLTEANLNQIIHAQERTVDRELAKSELHDRIRAVFDGGTLRLVPFAAGPEDVPDSVEDGRPFLVLVGHDAEHVRGDRLLIPPLVEKIFRQKGSQSDFRQLQNNLVFLVADDALREPMKGAMLRFLALQAICRPERIGQLADHQQSEVRERYRASEQRLATAIQSCYRHVFFPSRNSRLEGAQVELGHTALDMPSTAEQPGAGQRAVVRALENNQKLLRTGDAPLAPTYVRDQTPLKRGQITTAALRNEFRKDPRLPILLGDDNFIALVRKGIDEEVYIYRSGDLMLGKGDPWADIRIDENSIIHTVAFAREQGFWPRTPVPAVPPTTSDGSTEASAPVPTAPPAAGTRELRAEAPLREALTHLWDQAKAADGMHVTGLRIRVFDADEALRLLNGISGIANADRHATLNAEYETAAGSSLSLTFNGTPQDALVIKEFLTSQFRVAAEKDLQTTYTLTFASGLDPHGDEPGKLTEKLARLSTGAVEAFAALTRKDRA
ncbi:MAG: hypothetical protein AMXMBFR57_07170 [Acidimicrobiia bacterium]